MKVLYVNQDIGIDWCGHSGGATHIQSTLRAMRRLGHIVHILVRKVPEKRAPLDLEIPSYQAPEDVNWEEYDLIYERYSLWGSLSLSKSIPWHLEINAPLIEEQTRFRTPIDCEKALRIKNAICERAQRIVVVSPSLLAYVPQEARSKVVVVPNAVDRNLFYPLPYPNRFAFGYVGSMRPWHDLDTPLTAFLDLADEFKDIDFHVVGGGPKELFYRETFRHPRIFFHGLTVPESIPAYLGRFSCGIAPFIQNSPSYFSPLKIPEYLATRRTVITHPQFVTYPTVMEGVDSLTSYRDAMARQINMDRSNLLFPEIPDWQNCLLLS